MSNQNTETDKVPGTEKADLSELGLKTVGQFQIAIGWILGIAFIAFGIMLCNSIVWPLGALIILFGIGFIIGGYIRGAAKKAAAVAAINAKKAAERSARMEQMLVNMVGGNQQVAGDALAMSVACPKCGATIPSNAKFCPECGASTTATCAKCGASFAAGAKFCPECGTPAK